MTFFSLSLSQIYPLLSMAFILGLGFLVFFKNSKAFINRLFFMVTIVFGIWQFGTFMMFISSNDEAITFWDRFIYLGVVFMPAFQYHFSLLVTSSNKTRKIMLKIAYALSVVFLFFSRSDYFVSGVYHYRWGAHTIAQIGHHFFLAFFFFYIFALLYNFYRYFRDSDLQSEKYRMVYFAVSFAILNLIGGLGYLPAYKVNVYPISLLAPLAFSILIAYAIIVHRLMDIKLALRRSFVYISSVLAIVIPASAILYLTDFYFPKYLILISLAVLVLAVSVFSPTRDYYYRIANKYFFSSLYDVREVITKLSDGLRSTLDVTEVYNFISRTLIGTFHTKAVGVLNYDAVSGQYAVQFNSGFLLGDRKIFSGDKILQEEYIKKSKIVVVEEIKSVAYERHKEMIDTLMGLGAAVVVPLNIKDEMLGVMVLGNKESGDMFNDEDLRTLETVASQAAIAIKNAQLYGETRGFSVTLQKEVERQTKQLKEANVELQKLDKAKSDFISIASHQLRTPLTAIKGFTSMILEGSYGRVTNVVRDKLEKIFESTERLVRLVNDLLDLSHMEGGGMEYNFAKVDFDAMVRSVVEELTPPAEKKKLKFKWRTPDENIWVWADEQKLRQVVMNLIDNAIKYTPQGAVDVILERVDGNVQMSVKDTGMGMKKSELANLFQKFVRGTEAPRYYTEGAGIGLYVAKQLIEAQKGEVWAESPGEDKGSTFFVKMPEMKGGTS